MTQDDDGIRGLEERLWAKLKAFAAVPPVPYKEWEAKREAIQKDIALGEIRLLLDALRTAIAERDEARAERDGYLEELGKVIMACPMQPGMRVHPASEGVRKLRIGFEAAEARLEELTRERDEAKAAKDDAIADHRLLALHRKKQGDHDTKIIEGLQARLEEAKAVLGPFVRMEHAGWVGSVYEDGADDMAVLHHHASGMEVTLKDFRAARAFLQSLGGDDA